LATTQNFATKFTTIIVNESTNKSTELGLHNCKKRQIYSVAKMKAPFSEFTVCFCNCNRLLFMVEVYLLHQSG